MSHRGDNMPGYNIEAQLFDHHARAWASGGINAEMLDRVINDFGAASDILCAASDPHWRVALPPRGDTRPATSHQEAASSSSS